MTEIMRVDTVGLRNAVPTFDTLAAATSGILSRLAAALDAEGRCWGTDEIGARFEKDYLEGGGNARAALAKLGEAVSHVGAAVLVAADAVDTVEARTQSRFW